MPIRKIKKKKLIRKKLRKEPNIITPEMRVNTFTTNYGQTIIDGIRAGLKYAMKTDTSLKKCAEDFILSTMPDMVESTPGWILESRTHYLILMSLPLKVTETEKKRMIFWFGNNAKEISEMDAMELELRGGTTAGYKRDGELEKNPAKPKPKKVIPLKEKVKKKRKKLRR